jgi:hypothetical protein
MQPSQYFVKKHCISLILYHSSEDSSTKRLQACTYLFLEPPELYIPEHCRCLWQKMQMSLSCMPICVSVSQHTCSSNNTYLTLVGGHGCIKMFFTMHIAMDSPIVIGSEECDTYSRTKYFQIHTMPGTLMSLLETGTSFCDNLIQYIPP